ncbi:MAG: hypothetical protein AB8B55_19735 [Mariniblastus sp.]
MNRYFFLTLVACLLSGSNAFGQSFLEQLGRELIQKQQRGGGEQQRPDIRQQRMPSESGRESGGDRFTNPGFGDFTIPFREQTPQYVQPIQPGGQYVQPRYVQPGTQFNPSLSRPIYHSNPTIVSKPAFVAPTSPVKTRDYIVIRCPETAAGSAYYTLKSSHGEFGFTLSPGMEQRFRAGAGWEIGYNHGLIQKRHTLQGGKTYTLKRDTANHWQLYLAGS